MHHVPSAVMSIDVEAAEAGLYEMPKGLDNSDTIYESLRSPSCCCWRLRWRRWRWWQYWRWRCRFLWRDPVLRGAPQLMSPNAEPASMAYACSVGGEEHMAINMVPAGLASSVVYATPAEGFSRKKTAVRCARPAPSGGTCKNVPINIYMCIR